MAERTQIVWTALRAACAKPRGLRGEFARERLNHSPITSGREVAVLSGLNQPFCAGDSAYLHGEGAAAREFLAQVVRLDRCDALTQVVQQINGVTAGFADDGNGVGKTDALRGKLTR